MCATIAAEEIRSPNMYRSSTIASSLHLPTYLLTYPSTSLPLLYTQSVRKSPSCYYIGQLRNPCAVLPSPSLMQTTAVHTRETGLAEAGGTSGGREACNDVHWNIPRCNSSSNLWIKCFLFWVSPFWPPFQSDTHSNFPIK